MSENITLNDQERAALEALWRAGESALITAVPDELRNGVVDLYVKELVTFAKDGRKTVVNLTDEGRKLAVELFTPPLTMPTSEEAVKAWLQARGLWAEGDKVQVEDASYIYVILGTGYSVRGNTSSTNEFGVAFPRHAIKIEDIGKHDRELKRACAIARALNANAGKGE